MKVFLINIFIVFLGIVPFSAFGWWDVGHMAVAQISYEELSVENQKKADELIELFGSHFTSSRSYQEASCWADDLKNDGCEAFSRWHHSSLPYDPKNILSPKKQAKIIEELKGKDAIFALKECKKSLNSPVASVWTHAMMLRFLIHVVGDIHQPLHCTSLICEKHRNGDWGGNKTFVKFNGEKWSLHAVWDSIFGKGEKKFSRPLNEEDTKTLNELVQRIKERFPKEAFSKEELECMDPNVWREESYLLGTEAYSRLKEMEMDEQYISWGPEVCERRIALAGYRLGRFLSSTLNADSSLSRP